MNEPTVAEATLTDRYIQAVVRTVPEAQRPDIAAELAASIGDQLEARTTAGEPRKAAERAILIELGDPDSLAAGLVDRPLHLIGPRYYLEWRRLLVLLLWIVLPLSALGVALGRTLAGEPFGAIVGGTIGALITIAVPLMFWTTLVFVVIERTGARDGAVAQRAWSPDDLPAVHAAGTRFADMIASVVFLAVAAAAVVWDQTFGAVYLDGQWTSFLDPALSPWWTGGLLVLLAVEAAFQIVLHLNRRWTVALAVVNTVLNLVVAIPALWLLSRGELLNGELWDAILPAAESDRVFAIVSVITGFGIAAIALWDTVDGFLKARRAR